MFGAVDGKMGHHDHKLGATPCCPVRVVISGFEVICAFWFAHASNPWKTLNEQAVAPAITSNRSFGTLPLRVMLGVRSAWVLMMNLLNAEFLQAHTACCRG